MIACPVIIANSFRCSVHRIECTGKKCIVPAAVTFAFMPRRFACFLAAILFLSTWIRLILCNFAARSILAPTPPPSRLPVQHDDGFRDTFHMKHDERQFVVAKDSYGWYHVSKVVQFGLSPGPLLWARLASAAMRLGQAIVKPWEAAVSTYVDDPLMTVMGESAQARTTTVLLYVGLWLAIG